MKGAGKYGEAVTKLRAEIAPMGGVVVLVYKGVRGNGFEAHIPREVYETLPGALREVASHIEREIKEHFERAGN